MRKLDAVWLLSGLAAACLTRAAPAHADDTVSHCIDSSDRGQVLRDQGRLIEARDAFLACARESCPGPIRGDCATWSNDVEAKIPTVVLRPRDDAGRDLVQVRVFDGANLLVEQIDGRALPIDPGVHDLRFERQGVPPITVRLVAREGEKQRTVDVTWPATSKTAASPSSSPDASASRGSVPVGAWILGGVGLVGLGGFGYLGWTAKSEVDDMHDTCAPYCDKSRVDRARTRATLANVSLGVGILAIGAATYVVLTDRPEPRSEQAARRSRLSVTAGFVDSGVSAGLSGSF